MLFGGIRIILIMVDSCGTRLVAFTLRFRRRVDLFRVRGVYKYLVELG